MYAIDVQEATDDRHRTAKGGVAAAGDGEPAMGSDGADEGEVA
jgi:hypothetical protein